MEKERSKTADKTCSNEACAADSREISYNQIGSARDAHFRRGSRSRRQRTSRKSRPGKQLGKSARQRTPISGDSRSALKAAQRAISALVASDSEFNILHIVHYSPSARRTAPSARSGCTRFSASKRTIWPTNHIILPLATFVLIGFSSTPFALRSSFSRLQRR